MSLIFLIAVAPLAGNVDLSEWIYDMKYNLNFLKLKASPDVAIWNQIVFYFWNNFKLNRRNSFQDGNT